MPKYTESEWQEIERAEIEFDNYEDEDWDNPENDPLYNESWTDFYERIGFYNRSAE